MGGLHLNVGMLRDQRGIALPMSLLALLILSTLVISFALLATSEPLIATNQKMVAQARAVAESGLEQAIWALNNPTDPNGLPSPLPGTVPSPYDGSTDIAISNSSGTQIGVARVTVTPGTNLNERNVTTVGWVPTNTPKAARQKIQDLNSLKAMAKAAGTYDSGAGVSSLTFNAGNLLPNGIIFVDTVSGLNVDVNGANTTATSDLASVSIHGNSPADPSGIFRGMIIVAGTLSISGDFHARGMVYAVNDLIYMGTGTGLIEGAVMSQNIRDISSTTIDTNTGGNSSIVYNCGYATNPGGQMPQGFTVQPGTYKEVSGSSLRLPRRTC